MPRLSVVFDTNTYRALGWPRFAAIRDRERQHSIVAYASYFVVMEFLAYTADSENRAHKIATASLKRLWEHCKQFDGATEILRLLGDSEAQVPVTLFGEEPVGRSTFYSSLGYLVGRYCAGGFEGWPEGAEIGRAVGRDLPRLERQFASDLFRAVVQTVNPDATTWFDATKPSPIRDQILWKAKAGHGHQLMASAIVAKAAREVGREISGEQLSELARAVRELFPLPVHLYDQVVLDILERGLDMSRPVQANSLWDYQICFSVGRGAQVGGAPVWLISADNRILEAAQKAEVRNVYSLVEYERLLLGSTDDLAAAVDASLGAS